MRSRLRVYFDELVVRLKGRRDSNWRAATRHPDAAARGEAMSRMHVYENAINDAGNLLPPFELPWREAAARYRRLWLGSKRCEQYLERELRNAYERLDRLTETRTAHVHDEFTYCVECER